MQIAYVKTSQNHGLHLQGFFLSFFATAKVSNVQGNAVIQFLLRQAQGNQKVYWLV